MKHTITKQIIIIVACLMLNPFDASVCFGSQAQTYTVQIMSVSEKNTALEFLEKFKRKGYDAYVVETAGQDGSRTYKIRAGLFTSKEEAKKLAATLQGRGIDCWITTASQDNATAPETPGAPSVLQESDNMSRHMDNTARTKASSVNDNQSLQKEAVNGTTQTLRASVKTFKYFDDADGALHVTNAYKKIPPRFQTKIREISIVPVWFISLNAHDLVFCIDSDGEKKKIKLDGIGGSPTPPSPQVVKVFADDLRKEPLRIKYDPSRTDASGILHGSLYRTTGTSVGLEMITHGLAPCNPEAVPSLEKEIYREAEQKAKQEKAGIWGGQ